MNIVNIDIYKLLNLETTPLPLVLIIYLIVVALSMMYKPKFIFGGGSDDSDVDEQDYKKIGLFYIMLAIFCFVIVSSFVSGRVNSFS